MNTHFVLKHPWYEEVKAGRKTIEYRSITPYWTARLANPARPITTATFSHGYTRKGLLTRKVLKIDVGPCPYPGWSGEFYRVHIEQKAGA